MQLRRSPFGEHRLTAIEDKRRAIVQAASA